MRRSLKHHAFCFKFQNTYSKPPYCCYLFPWRSSTDSLGQSVSPSIFLILFLPSISTRRFTNGSRPAMWSSLWSKVVMASLTGLVMWSSVVMTGQWPGLRTKRHCYNTQMAWHILCGSKSVFIKRTQVGIMSSICLMAKNRHSKFKIERGIKEKLDKPQK